MSSFFKWKNIIIERMNSTAAMRVISSSNGHSTTIGIITVVRIILILDREDYNFYWKTDEI
jgi:hypothetical protein